MLSKSEAAEKRKNRASGEMSSEARGDQLPAGVKSMYSAVSMG